MPTIDEYLDRAKDNQKLKSDRQLGALIGIKGSHVSAFRTKKAWPSDATMIRIAELAGEDEQEALLSLNIWRNTDSAVGPVYSRLMDKLKAAAMLGIALTFIIAAISGTPTLARADQLHRVFNGIYYDKYCG